VVEAKNPKPQVKRGPGKPFPKGVSGNPGGRKPMPPEHVEAFRATTAEAIETLVEMMRGAEKDSDRLKAIDTLLERAWGRAPPSVEESDDGTKGRSELVEAMLALAKKGGGT
jgi:hypothetical protein